MQIFNILNGYIFQFLVFLYHLLGNNLGLAIIALTVIVKAVLMPLVAPSMKSAQKMRDLKPQLEKLKKKHTDKAALQQAQLELYKQHGVNPAAGCLPQIVQIVILISLYQVFIKFLGQSEVDGVTLNTNFLYLDLAKPDSFYILPILAGLSQLVFSLMMSSGLEHHVHNTKNKKTQEKDNDQMEMAQAMQSQMVYMMPLMTIFISLKFHSGLVLYWVISTLFSIAQQYYFSGWGGLIPAFNKLKSTIIKK